MSAAGDRARLAADPVALTQALIRCPSVTPADAGALVLLAEVLEGLGFECHPQRYGEVDNLYARRGRGGPNFCFAGHTDVVPVGRAESWSVEPFAGDLKDGVVWGRGAADMKGAIAAFVAAVAGFPQRDGTISLLITGDEEGVAVDGTTRVLDWLDAKGERLDACVVGEPTNPTRFGEMAKIGRRGSLNGRLRVQGAQGHVAYPQLADNPIPRLVRLLAALEVELDGGTDHFQASNLEITTVDVGNPATNVIPAEARAGFNVRFNDRWTGAGLEQWLRARLDAVGVAYALETQLSGESFVTPPGPLSMLLTEACRSVLGVEPELSTTGGTSDARFIRRACPVLEFGLVGATMHKVDERAAVTDILALSRVYRTMLDGFY